MVTLSTGWTLIINILAWPIIHLSFSYFCLHLNNRYFTEDNWYYRQKDWEKSGGIYEKLGVNKWKTIVPDGGGVFKGGFRKKRLLGRSGEYFQMFIQETRRAEFTHLILIPPSLLFFIWNTLEVGFIMVAYALIVNIPFIIIQRYNRFRFQRILTRKQQKRTAPGKKAKMNSSFDKKTVPY
ncbi:glycosyl-4,4'-diaponeurosporenoate acyltransferase [Pseudalkalibacillus caeni]|uniref:Glycosyl-4,4'-diaponeurosporenoate acyltransferase n=1 Tax=Exobacillus caeni TaxID=2574798 RepID=A0A5R9F0X8_9BACL|nr:glycosyl-4,4'-diaponeurosporenoate acyltransferase [Pseudalkalibacillus caeni]TLS36080.1 glycosyl-4,4'-diaponeurosporenoate acyltransferase [Pseudalkalibacillus caeni]